MSDPFDLKRFVQAQDPVIADVKNELQQGAKWGHWMWFIFPQLRGLGHSSMAQKYGIVSRSEASAYLAHDVLGPRLVECTRLVNRVEGRSAEQIFGDIDAVKFRSSMTLFAHIAGDSNVFVEALDKYYAGQPDPLTTARLEKK